MKMPKYKPTKWKLQYCLDCKSVLGRYSWNCKNKHKIVERDNVPFFIEEMQIEYFGKWSRLKSTKPEGSYPMSRTKIGEIILGCGVEPKGYITNQWWMWAKVGSSLTLIWLEQDDE